MPGCLKKREKKKRIILFNQRRQTIVRLFFLRNVKNLVRVNGYADQTSTRLLKKKLNPRNAPEPVVEIPPYLPSIFLPWDAAAAAAYAAAALEKYLFRLKICL